MTGAPSPRIGAVLFDLDGVLTTDASGSTTTLRALQAATGLDEGRLWRAFAPVNHDLLLGRTTHAEAWPGICARLGADLPIRLLDAAFDATPMNAAMLALAASLRPGVRTGIVTDNKRDRVDRVVGRHGLAAGFDPIVVSADVGSDKRTPAIFEHALARLGVEPGAALFIDNTPANLVAPRALGLHTLHFDDAANDVRALAAVLRAQFALPAG